MKDSKLKQYIVAMIALFKKQAFEAKEQADHYGPSVANYDKGLLTGYAHILETFKNQTFALWIDRKDLGFDIEPEVDLLGARRNLEEERIDMESPTDPLTEHMIEGYIYELMTSLKEEAIDAKNTLENQEDTDDGNEFERGYLMAYYRVISTMQAQASRFGLDHKTYNLSIINPDLELIPSNPKK